VRVLVQRVSGASVHIDAKVHASIRLGLLVLLGIESGDTEADIEYLVSKLSALRIFSDKDGKMNLDVNQVGGEMMVISQFTLHASTKKGNRPSFIRAAPPAEAIPLYERFIEACSRTSAKQVAAGVFGADMKVELVNDGPVTIIIDSRNRE
jgi:D-tyrosyl-tRNA(Tyr) deacylase